MTCKLCPLFNDRAQVAGYGLPDAKLIVVGDWPNGDDERTLIPFSSGRDPRKESAAQLIRNALTRVVGLDTDTEVYWAHALRCNYHHRSKQLKKIKPEWLQTCRSANLEPDLQGVSARVILLCGEYAAKSFLGELPGGLHKMRGTTNTFYETTLGGIKRYIRLTYSPSFIQANRLYHLDYDHNGKPVSGKGWNPPGSVGWFFLKDIRAIQAKLKEIEALQGVAA